MLHKNLNIDIAPGYSYSGLVFNSLDIVYRDTNNNIEKHGDHITMLSTYIRHTLDIDFNYNNIDITIGQQYLPLFTINAGSSTYTKWDICDVHLFETLEAYKGSTNYLNTISLTSSLNLGFSQTGLYPAYNNREEWNDGEITLWISNHYKIAIDVVDYENSSYKAKINRFFLTTDIYGIPRVLGSPFVMYYPGDYPNAEITRRGDNSYIRVFLKEGYYGSSGGINGSAMIEYCVDNPNNTFTIDVSTSGGRMISTYATDYLHSTQHVGGITLFADWVPGIYVHIADDEESLKYLIQDKFCEKYLRLSTFDNIINVSSITRDFIFDIWGNNSQQLLNSNLLANFAHTFRLTSLSSYYRTDPFAVFFGNNEFTPLFLNELNMRLGTVQIFSTPTSTNYYLKITSAIITNNREDTVYSFDQRTADYCKSIKCELASAYEGRGSIYINYLDFGYLTTNSKRIWSSYTNNTNDKLYLHISGEYKYTDIQLATRQ